MVSFLFYHPSKPTSALASGSTADPVGAEGSMENTMPPLNSSWVTPAEPLCVSYSKSVHFHLKWWAAAVVNDVEHMPYHTQIYIQINMVASTPKQRCLVLGDLKTYSSRLPTLISSQWKVLLGTHPPIVWERWDVQKATIIQEKVLKSCFEYQDFLFLNQDFLFEPGSATPLSLRQKFLNKHPQSAPVSW